MSDQLTRFKAFKRAPDWHLEGGVWWLREYYDVPPVPCHPLDDSGLYRNFIDTRPTRPGFLAFAKKHGLLGIGQPDSVTTEAVYIQESFDQWKRERDSLKLADALRLALRERSFGQVERNFSPIRDGMIFRIDGAIYRRFEPVENGPPVDLRFAVGRALQTLVNEHLDGDVAPRLLWDHSYKQLSLYRVPKNLRTALWLQFARAVEGNKTFARCVECKAEFEIDSPDGARKDKKYHSDACRARAYRRRLGQKKEGSK